MGTLRTHHPLPPHCGGGGVNAAPAAPALRGSDAGPVRDDKSTRAYMRTTARAGPAQANRQTLLKVCHNKSKSEDPGNHLG